MDPTNEEKVQLCEQAEAELLAEDDYSTATDRGEKQTEYLKALDFDDIIVKGWRVYNLCRAKTREGGTKTCGMYFFRQALATSNQIQMVFLLLFGLGDFVRTPGQ